MRTLVLRPLIRCLPALAVVALLAAPVEAQQLYKYVGPDGRVQYTDRPPATSQKAENVALGGTGATSPQMKVVPRATDEGVALQKVGR